MLWPPVRLPADANLGGRVAELGIMQPSVGRTETRNLMVDGYRVGMTRMFGRVSKQMIASAAMNPAGVSTAVREIAPEHLHQGAIAVGTPTERSGARSHPVGMDAEAPND